MLVVAAMQTFQGEQKRIWSRKPPCDFHQLFLTFKQILAPL